MPLLEKRIIGMWLEASACQKAYSEKTPDKALANGSFVPVVLLLPFYLRSTISSMQLPNLCLILGVIFTLLLQSETFGQTQPAPLTKPFEGCYELTLGRWWPWSFGGDNEFVTPPGRIKLLSERGTKGFEEEGFLIRTIPPRKGATPGRGGPSYWNVISPNEIDLNWNDGFTGVTLSLKKHGNELRGWAHPHFDSTPLIPRIAYVIARKIACEPPQ